VGFAGVFDLADHNFCWLHKTFACRKKKSAMNIQHHSGFNVVGVAARTQNADENSGNGKIGKIWQTFLGQNLAAKIPNKVGVDLIAVYSDYETDHTGHYSYLLGLPVSSVVHLSAKLAVKHIAAGRYAVITSKRGPVSEVVPEVWRRIWSMSPRELGGTRAFLADYEIYDQRAADPANTQIDVYVGLC
jgi:predicted transcriptional regulator YdeE